MKTLRKFMLPLTALLLLFSIAGAGFAQDYGEVYCLDLEEADCAVYTEFQSSYPFPSSTAFDATISGDFDVPDAPFAFSVALSGAYSTDVEAYQSAVETFNALTLGDVNLSSTMDLLQGVIGAWDAELFIDVSGTPELAMFTGEETIDLYIVDGVLYADLTLVGTLLGDDSIAGVYGIDPFEIINFGLDSVTMGDIADALEGMGMGMMGADDPFTMGFQQGFQQGFQGGQMQDMLTEEDLSAFATISRADDQEINGENVVVFVTEIDPSAVFSVPVFREAIIQGVEQGIDEDGEMPEDFDMETFIDSIATGVEGSTIVVTEYYSEEMSIIVGVDLAFDFTLDPASIVAAMGEELGENDVPVSFTFNIEFLRNSINEIDGIELPEGSQIVPFFELLGGAGA